MIKEGICSTSANFFLSQDTSANISFLLNDVLARPSTADTEWNLKDSFSCCNANCAKGQFQPLPMHSLFFE